MKKQKAKREDVLKTIERHKPFGNRKFKVWTNRSYQHKGTIGTLNRVHVIEEGTGTVLYTAPNNYTAVKELKTFKYGQPTGLFYNPGGNGKAQKLKETRLKQLKEHHEFLKDTAKRVLIRDN